jgi:hypothetical protein
MHGQTTMNAIFGEMKEPELFSPRNGMITFYQIEAQFDSGRLVLEKRIVAEVLKWLAGKTRDYHSGMEATEFTSSMTSARTRYLYLHYCVQVLRKAWRSDSGEAAAISLTDEIDHVYRGTAGRYVPKKHAQGFYRRSFSGEHPLVQIFCSMLHTQASQDESEDLEGSSAVK